MPVDAAGTADMPVDPAGPDKHLAAARVQAKAAQAADAKASQTLLKKLLGQSVESRFAAFEDQSKNLTPADRRTLLASIKNADMPARIAPVSGTASRLATWKARLPYRVGGIAVAGVALGIALIGMIVAVRNTPSHAVEIVTPLPIPVQFKRADGVIVADRLEPRTRYFAMSDRGGQTLLRLWLPQQGYATASVPSEWLRPALPARAPAGQ